MANSKLKGLTIKIGGDTTDLISALKKPQTEIKTLESSLKSVNQMLKYDPSNTELLSQKQKILNQDIEQTKTKLATLKQAQSALPSDVDKTSAQYINLQQEIQKAETHLKNLKKQQDLLPASVQAWGAKLGEVGTKLNDVGTTMSTKVTAPMVALEGGALKSFETVESGLDVVKQKTGASGEALESMNSIVKDLATSMDTSFEDAGTAVGELNTRFGLTGDELEKTSKQFLEFAKVNNTDVNTSIDQVQKAMSAFNVDASHAGEVLDMMNKVGQDTGVSMETLQEGLIKNSVAFQEMGLNMNQSITLMGQIEKSGADSNTVLTGLRKALKNATAEGKPMNQALSELQDSIKNGKDGMSGLQEAYDLFGKSGDQVYQAVKNGSLDFKDLAQSADGASGSVSDVYNNTDSLSRTLTPLKNTLLSALAEVGSQLATTLLPMAKNLASQLEAFANWFKKLSPWQKDLIVKIMLIVTAIGPLLIMIGKISTGISSIISVAGMISPIIGIIAPFVPMILGIVVAITAVILIMNNWGTITQTVGGIVNGIINAVVSNFRAFQTWLGTSLNNISQFASNVKTEIANLVSSIINTFFGLRDKAINWGADMLQGFIDGIKQKVGQVKDAVGNVAKSIKKKIGFSVPEEGPLADADTYMPDFMNLLTKGIEANKAKVLDSLNGLANDMSNGVGAMNATTNNNQSINLNASFVATMDGQQVTDVVKKKMTTQVRNVANMRGGVAYG